MKLGIEHYDLKLYTNYKNNDPELTLTCFTIMSILANLVSVLPGPRFQVSVYMIIGPLVLFFYRNVK